jgi:hypothetical protein
MTPAHRLTPIRISLNRRAERVTRTELKKLKILAAAGLIARGASGPAIAADVHCYTMGVAQTIVPDLFNKNNAGMTAERVELGGEFPDEPGTCYVEVTTNTGLLMKYKFRYNGATGTATIDLIRAGTAVPESTTEKSQASPRAGKDCSGIPLAERTLDCAP